MTKISFHETTENSTHYYLPYTAVPHLIIRDGDHVLYTESVEDFGRIFQLTRVCNYTKLAIIFWNGIHETVKFDELAFYGTKTSLRHRIFQAAILDDDFQYYEAPIDNFIVEFTPRLPPV